MKTGNFVLTPKGAETRRGLNFQHPISLSANFCDICVQISKSARFSYPLCGRRRAVYKVGCCGGFIGKLNRSWHSCHDLLLSIKDYSPLTMRILATIIVLVVGLVDLLDLHIFFISHLPSFIFFVFVHYRIFSLFFCCNFAPSKHNVNGKSM